MSARTGRDGGGPQTLGLPGLLVVFYGNPDRYPPTRNAILMLREHFRVHLVCRAGAEPPSASWPDEVRVERVGPRLSDQEKTDGSPAAKLREYLGFVWAVRRALSAERPAVAYAYEPHALSALALAGCRAKVVYHRHELEDAGPFVWGSIQSWVQALARRRGRQASLVVFPEEHRAEMYQRAVGDPRSALIVPNFPLLAAFPAPSPWPALLEARWQQKVVLYRGSLGPGNGILQMVRALPHLDPGVSLRLCGSADPRFVQEFEGIAAELGVAGRLRYDGFVPFDRLNRETLAAAAGTVLYQPTGVNNEFNATATNKLYEYAACGVPVVVPSSPTYRSFFAGESWVEHAQPDDPAAVAAAIQRLFVDRGRYEERCRAARRAFEERFNYEIVFAPLLERILALAG